MCLTLYCALLRSGDCVLVDACQVSGWVIQPGLEAFLLGGHVTSVWRIHSLTPEACGSSGRDWASFAWSQDASSRSPGPTRLVLRTCRMWSMSRCPWTEPCDFRKTSSFCCGKRRVHRGRTQGLHRDQGGHQGRETAPLRKDWLLGSVTHPLKTG